MRILVTATRMPFALSMIRAFGDESHTVYGADTFRTAPANHSKAVQEYFTIRAPSDDTPGFIEDLKKIAQQHSIDMIVPSFEEVFYIAKHADEFADVTDLYVAPFDSLARLHNKDTFRELCDELGLRTPQTTTVSDQDALRQACESYGTYMARASYSRGGLDLLTNSGPRDGTMTIDEAKPTEANPWLVQEFIVGKDLCSYSLARDGVVHGHMVYEHPKESDHSAGIQFASIDEPETLDIVNKVVAASNYTGQISFDYMRDDKGLVMIECNPRGTDGATLFKSNELTGAALADAEPPPFVMPEGREDEIRMALVLDMLNDWKHTPSDLKDLVSVPGIYARERDAAPFFYQFLSYSHVLSFNHHKGAQHHAQRQHKSNIMDAMFDDISWDGTPIQ